MHIFVQCYECKKKFEYILPSSITTLKHLHQLKKSQKFQCMDCTPTAMPQDTIAQGDLLTGMIHLTTCETGHINGLAYNCIRCTSSYVEGIDGLWGWCMFCATCN